MNSLLVFVHLFTLVFSRRDFLLNNNLTFDSITTTKVLTHVLQDFKANGMSLRVQVPLTGQSTEHHLLSSDKREKLIDTAVKINYPLLECFKLLYNLKIEYKIDFCDDDNDLDRSEVKIDKTQDVTLETCAINHLLTDNIDISLFPLLITPENVNHLDFPGVSSVVKTKFIFLQPKLSLIMNVYTLPFTRGVWFAAFGLVAIVICLLYVVAKWQWHKLTMNYKNCENNDTKNDNFAKSETNENEMPDSLVEVSFLAIGAISQQGAEKEPNDLQGRTITWFLFLAFMFLYAAYSASIVALLQATSPDIHNVRDLLDSPLEIGVHDSSLMKRIIPQISGDDRMKILEKSGIQTKNTIDSSKFTPTMEGITKLRAVMYAFHVESHIGYSLIEETFEEVEKCSLQEVQLLQFPTDLYFAIKKNSPFFEMFKIGFLKLRERGIHHRETSLLHTPKPSCWTLDTVFNSVGILDCYFAMALFAGGVLLSLGIFFVEMVMDKTHVGFRNKKLFLHK